MSSRDSAPGDAAPIALPSETSGAMASPAIIARLKQRVAAYAGLDMPDWVLAARLRERVTALGLDSADHYIDLCTSRSGARELDLLLETLRVGETRLFRHAAHVRALAEVIAPALRGKSQVAAWSAGCSTGEEAYTMAIILTEKLAGTSCSIHITATDLSPRALAAARHGRYPASALDHVPEPWRRIGFEAEGGSSFYRVAARAARRVTFEQHNLLDSPYPGPFDLICCRNVLIYFTAAARRRVIDKLIASLGPGGMLLVGYSESLRDVDELEAERVAGTVIYRRQTSQPAPRTRRVTLPMSAKPGRDSRRSGPVQPTRAQRTTAPLGLVPTRTRRITAPLPGLVPRADTRPSGSRPDDGQPPRPRPGDGPSERSELLIRLAGRYDDAARLSAELAPALAGTYQRAHIDLDGAEYLGDDAAAIVTRAVSAARATGIELVVHASRPGPRRWLRRHRLDRGSHRTAPGQTAPGQDPSDSDGGEP